jgi:hypothetical protein
VKIFTKRFRGNVAVRGRAGSLRFAYGARQHARPIVEMDSRPAVLRPGRRAGFGQAPRLVKLAGLFQRASIVTGFGWLTALYAQALT